MEIVILLLLAPFVLSLEIGDILGGPGHGGNWPDRPPKPRRTEQPPQWTRPPQETQPQQTYTGAPEPTQPDQTVPPAVTGRLRRPRSSRAPRPTGRPLPSRRPGKTQSPATLAPPRHCNLFCKDGYRCVLGPECVPNCPANSCDALECNPCEQCVMVNDLGCEGLDCEQHPKCIPAELATCEPEAGVPPCGCGEICRMEEICTGCPCHPEPVCYADHSVSITSEQPTEQPIRTTDALEYG